MDRTPSGATTPGLCELVSNGNEGVFRIPQSSSINRASSSDFSVSYPGDMLGVAYLYAEVQSVHSVALVEWATSTTDNNERFQRAPS